MPRTLRLNTTHYFVLKIPNKLEFQLITSNLLADIGFKDFMKIYKDYILKSHIYFWWVIQLCHPIINSNLQKTYYKAIITEKNKTIDNKIEQNKAQYDLDKETDKISALLWGNISKCKFLTGKDAIVILNNLISFLSNQSILF